VDHRRRFVVSLQLLHGFRRLLQCMHAQSHASKLYKSTLNPFCRKCSICNTYSFLWAVNAGSLLIKIRYLLETWSTGSTDFKHSTNKIKGMVTDESLNFELSFAIWKQFNMMDKHNTSTWQSLTCWKTGTVDLVKHAHLKVLVTVWQKNWVGRTRNNDRARIAEFGGLFPFLQPLLPLPPLFSLLPSSFQWIAQR
jgi:hypothetical protein